MAVLPALEKTQSDRYIHSLIVPQLLYSPTQDIVEYEIKKFQLGFSNEVTEYQDDPSPELDA